MKTIMSEIKNTLDGIKADYTMYLVRLVILKN